MINGATEPVSDIDAAKQQLLEAAMRFPMNGSALITSFVNTAMQSARIDALEQFLLEDQPQDSLQTKQERFQALLAQALRAKAQGLNETLSKPQIQIASGGRA